MATIKSFTDLSQSKVLATFLPLESADMYWSFGDIKFMDNDYDPNIVEHIPCWSLAALLGVLPNPSLHKTLIGWRCDSYNENCTKCTLGETVDNPVDACVDMVVKLHEINLL